MNIPEILRALSRKTPAGIKRLIPDGVFVSLMYYASYGKLPDLKNPITFDEKIQWYKLHHRNPLMTVMADKIKSRDYVRSLGYDHILNEVYFIKSELGYRDFDNLPDKCVIKANHGSDMNIFYDKKNNANIDEMVKTMKKWLRINRFDHTREWSYKNIEPAVICEKFLINKELGELVDYKFYCYDGKPEVLFVCAGRFSKDGVKYNAYDMDWNRIYVTKGKPGLDIEFEKPDNFEELKKTAAALSKGFPFVRVDLYSVEGKVYFSEFTFYPDTGVIPFSPDEYNKFFGDFFNPTPVI